jgi:EAL and modified HD-GYP domain-containing signal transduction protein
MLAEKVETQDELDAALSMGYEYFQGYFFAKPKMISACEVPACKMNSIRLLRELQKPELDFDRLEWLTRLEVSLARKLLRYVNSAAFGRRVEIHSIKNALVLLGETEIRKMVSLAIMPGLVTDKPSELVRTSLLRARTCETIAAHSRLRSRQSDCFLMGLFSLLDAMIGRPLDGLIAELGLPGDVRLALAGEPDAPCSLQSIYNLCLACEQADSTGIQECSARLAISPDQVSDLFMDALSWSEELYQEAVR